MILMVVAQVGNLGRDGAVRSLPMVAERFGREGFEALDHAHAHDAGLNFRHRISSALNRIVWLWRITLLLSNSVVKPFDTDARTCQKRKSSWPSPKTRKPGGRP